MNGWLAFVAGWGIGYLVLGLWASWDSIIDFLTRTGWTPGEVCKPIAWDGPWTDGYHFWDHGHGWREPKCKMKWNSPTGRELVSWGNEIEDFKGHMEIPAWTCVYR